MKYLTLILLFLIVGCEEQPEYNKEPLPEKFKNYQPITNKMTFGAHEMSLLFTSDEDIEYATLENGGLLAKTRSKDKVSEFSVLNSQGDIIRHYTHEDGYEHGDEALVRGYIINTDKKYYKTWAFDGEPAEKPIVQENASLDYPSEKARQRIDEILKTPDLVYLEYDFDYKDLPHKNDTDSTETDEGKIRTIEPQTTVYELMYLKNKVWHQFYTLIDVSDRISWVQNMLATSEHLFYKLNPKTRDFDVIQNKDLHYDYFHKIVKQRIVIPGGAGSSSVEHLWLGNLYTTLNIEGEALKIYEKLYLDEEFKLTPIKINGQTAGTFSDLDKHLINAYILYKNPDANYYLFTNRPNKLFVIKKIRK